MIKGYIFTVEKGELVCKKIVDGGKKTTKFYGKDAIDIFKRKDKIRFKRVKVTQHSVILESDKTRLRIDDSVLEDKNNYIECLPNNLNKVARAIERYNKNIGVYRVKRGTQVGIAVAGIAVTILLAATAGRFITRNAEDPVIDFYEEENDEEDLVDNSEVIYEDDDIIVTEDEPVEVVEDVVPDEPFVPDEQAIDDTYNAQRLLEELNQEMETVKVSYSESYDEVKFQHAYDRYMDIINERATRWGVDPRLMVSMLSQESGGYKTNLMQIQFDSWKDQQITLYNFELEKYETIVLTDNPEKYWSNPNIQAITRDDLMNPKTNISVACIIMQYSYGQMNQNMIAAIQAYNFGTGAMKDVINAAAEAQGITYDDIINDPSNLSFLDYRDVYDKGDHMYVENVLQFLQNPEEGIYIRYMDNDGQEQGHVVAIQNESAQKTY